MTSAELSDIVSIFTDPQWRDFERKKLGLAEDEITAIEEQGFDSLQSRTASVDRWAELNLNNSLSDLRELKHEFFCGQTTTILSTDSVTELPEALSSAIQLQGDTSTSHAGPNDNSEDVYRLNGKTGQILIISNSKNSQHTQAVKMKKLWVDEFKCSLFTERIQENQTVEQMKKHFDEMACMEERPAYVVVVVITDVEKASDKISYVEYLTGIDGSIIEIDEMKRAFKNVHHTGSKILQGVPKIFIFGGCRGQPFRITEGKSNTVNKDTLTGDLIPSMSDMLSIFPPIAEQDQTNASFENATNACRFITDLDEVFRRYGRKKHVVDIVHRLNKKVAWMSNEMGGQFSGCRGASSCVSTLRKKLFLFEDSALKTVAIAKKI